MTTYSGVMTIAQYWEGFEDVALSDCGMSDEQKEILRSVFYVGFQTALSAWLETKGRREPLDVFLIEAAGRSFDEHRTVIRQELAAQG